MENDKDKIQAAIISLKQLGVYLVVLPIIRSLVIMLIFNWYVSSTFDIATLSIFQAYGLSLLVTILTYKTPSKMEQDWNNHYYKDIQLQRAKDSWKNVRNKISGYIFILILAWIGHFFV